MTQPARAVSIPQDSRYDEEVAMPKSVHITAPWPTQEEMEKSLHISKARKRELQPIVDELKARLSKLRRGTCDLHRTGKEAQACLRCLTQTSVFLNIPYDEEFSSLYVAYIVGLIQLGLVLTLPPKFRAGIAGSTGSLSSSRAAVIPSTIFRE
jgi:hypothetical protein